MSKVFNENWFKPEARGGPTSLNDIERREIEWWCLHHKEGVRYLTWRLMEYFEAVDANDTKSIDALGSIIRACLPYYWEDVSREDKQ